VSAADVSVKLYLQGYYSVVLLTPAFISFIHLENVSIARSRNLLRGDPSPTTVKKISFKQLVEQRSVALWYQSNL